LFCKEAAAAAPTQWGDDDGFRPYDIRIAIREHFRTSMPSSWFINDPEIVSEGFAVKLTIPPEWGGNPNSAARNLCPDDKNQMWKHIRHLMITPVYKKRSWAIIQCP
jgi:hypothetical protein